MAKIDELRFDDKNFNQHTEHGMSLLEKSLQKNGAGRSILIDKDNNIIAGNGIVEAAGNIGLEDMQIVESDGTKIVAVKRTDLTLDSKEGRAMALADNATALADIKWNKDFIAEEDDKWGFEPDNWGEFTSEPHDYFGDERERTYDKVNLDKFDSFRATNKYGFPVLKGADYIPDALIGFNEAKTAKKKDVGIHFFIDDYQFERIWENPDNYIALLKQFDCVFTPDFSLYIDMPLAMKIWNLYRSRLIGQIMEDNGITVIPTLSWAGEETFEFAFDGLPKESTYAVSTVGVMRDEHAKSLWIKGMKQAVEALKPKTILLYGPQIDFDWGEINVANFKQRQFNRTKNDIIESNGDALENNQL